MSKRSSQVSPKNVGFGIRMISFLILFALLLLEMGMVDLTWSGRESDGIELKEVEYGKGKGKGHNTTSLNGGEITGGHHGGMGVLTTALIIVGEMAGGGVLAMPEAMLFCGWSGIVVILLGNVGSAYTGIQLGRCWAMLQEHWPEYRQHTRKPYPEIAYRAVGPWLRTVVSLFVSISLFGVSVVFILLSSTIFQGLISMWTNGNSISFCYLVLAVGGILLPITMLKSPKDFWPAIVVAMISTTFAITFIMIGTGIDGHRNGIQNTYPPTSFRNWFLGFATIIFSYGGHAAFPTILHDMHEPTKFTKSVTIAYAVILLYYLPVSIGAYMVYGGTITTNVLDSVVTTKWIYQGATLLICLHVVLSFIIVSNPVQQEVEELFRIPQNFTWKRIVSRTVIMIGVVFCAETIPHFGAVLDLVSACTTTFLTFVFPQICYIMLLHKFKRDQPNGKFPMGRLEIAVNIILLLVGLIGGIAASYSAIYSIAYPPPGRSFSPPCYVNISAAHM